LRGALSSQLPRSSRPQLRHPESRPAATTAACKPPQVVSRGAWPTCPIRARIGVCSVN